MPLRLLADQLIQQSRSMDGTPVLVTPRHLSLRQPFFVHLVRAAWQQSVERVRIDWYLGLDRSAGFDGGLRDLWVTSRARHFASKVNRAIAKASTGDYPTCETPVGSLEVTASIARPGSYPETLVIGLSDDSAILPRWTQRVALTGWPTESPTVPSMTVT